jgi:hypothetical protein
MLNLEILEDSSPFFVRFKFTNLDKIVTLCRPFTDQKTDGFLHYKLNSYISEKVISFLPFADKFQWQYDRVSLFITNPGHYYRAHKDGLNNIVSFNIPIEIDDDLCVTSWYDDSVSKCYHLDDYSKSSRELIDFNKTLHVPIKTMIAKKNECILFNTNIFHDWDNTLSKNRRTILTLRLLDHSLDFYTIKETIFK